MSIKRPFSLKILYNTEFSKPNMDYWLYTPRINESGDNVNTLYFYNNAVGPAQIVVPNENTELQDYQRVVNPYNNAYANLPFYNHTTIRSVDLQKVPFRNNSMAYAFNNCRNLVSVSNIPDGVTNMSNTFTYCRNFNHPITIPNSVTNMDSSFSSCSNFNQPITIPNSVTTMSGTFFGCSNFNQPIVIPDGVTNMDSSFSSCSNFNQPIVIPDGVTNMDSSFSSCSNFNQPITIPNSVTNMGGIFQSCSNFNQPITIPNSVTNMDSSFRFCRNFNHPITIPNSVTDMSRTFQSCPNFNQPITIPEGVTGMDFTFFGCSNFNQPITIPEGVTGMDFTFFDCYNFNQPVTIPEGVTSLSNTFQNCYNFNQPVTIPEGVTSLGYTFQSCYNFSKDIVIYADKVYDVQNCFYNTTLNKDVYIVLGGPYSNGGMLQVKGGYIQHYYSSNDTVQIYNYDGRYSYVYCERNSAGDITVDAVAYYAWDNSSANFRAYTNRYNYTNGYVGSNYFTQLSIPVEGNLSQTHLQFILDGYSTTNRKNGVLLKDINIVDPLPYEPVASIPAAWTYTTAYNSRGVKINTLESYNVSIGGTSVTVPYGHTVLTNETLRNTTIRSVDLQKVPFRNNSMVNAFYNCRNLVSVSNISNSVTNMCNTFYFCNNFNQPVTIPNSVTDMSSTFYYCNNFNQSITIPNSVTNMNSTFQSCSNFNQLIVISNSVTDMGSTFEGCNNFNQPVTIPNSVTNMSRTFRSCRNFNHPITIPNSVTNMNRTFQSCYNFNQPVTIPEGVTDMCGTFQGCSNFNQPIVIPDGVTSIGNTFWLCDNFNQPVTIQSTQINNAVDFFYGTTLNKNVYIPMNGTYGGEFMDKQSRYIMDYYSSNSTINIWPSNISGAQLFTRDTTNDRILKSVQYYAWTNSTKNVTCYTNVATPVNYSTYPFVYYNFPQNISLTYQSFIMAGYSNTTRKDGVLLYDLDSLNT